MLAHHRRRHPRGHPAATNAFAAELATEAGAPTVQLWLLRLLARTSHKLLTAISDHAALAQPGRSPAALLELTLAIPAGAHAAARRWSRAPKMP